MRRYALYSFVISLLWLGFVCAVSFIAMPATLNTDLRMWSEAYALFNVVAHKSLNRVEWICCAFSWLLMFRIRIVRERGSMIVLCVITAMLAFQTWALLPSLGGCTPISVFYTMQLNPILDALKCLALGVLAAMQIQSFARAVISE